MFTCFEWAITASCMAGTISFFSSSVFNLKYWPFYIMSKLLVYASLPAPSTSCELGLKPASLVALTAPKSDPVRAGSCPMPRPPPLGAWAHFICICLHPHAPDTCQIRCTPAASSYMFLYSALLCGSVIAHSYCFAWDTNILSLLLLLHTIYSSFGVEVL